VGWPSDGQGDIVSVDAQVGDQDHVEPEWQRSRVGGFASEPGEQFRLGVVPLGEQFDC
jgi:hypothetical protein